MRSIFCKVKQAKKHGFRAFRVKERQQKTRTEPFAKFEKVKNMDLSL